jgi:hypothetical protein
MSPSGCGGWLLLAVVAFALGRGNLLATGLLFAGSGAACYWLSPRTDAAAPKG